MIITASDLFLLLLIVLLYLWVQRMHYASTVEANFLGNCIPIIGRRVVWRKNDYFTIWGFLGQPISIARKPHSTALHD